MFFGGLSGWVAEWQGYCRATLTTTVLGIGVVATVASEDHNRLAIGFTVTGNTAKISPLGAPTTVIGIDVQNAAPFFFTADYWIDIVGNEWKAISGAGTNMTVIQVTQQKELPGIAVQSLRKALANGNLTNIRQPNFGTGDNSGRAIARLQSIPQSLDFLKRANQPLHDIIRRLGSKRIGD